MGLNWPDFILVFVIHFYLYAGVYSIMATMTIAIKILSEKKPEACIIAACTCIEHHQEKQMEHLGRICKLQVVFHDSL